MYKILGFAMVLVVSAPLASSNHDPLYVQQEAMLRDVATSADIQPAFAENRVWGHLLSFEPTGHACAVWTDRTYDLTLARLYPFDYYQVALDYRVEGLYGLVPVFAPGSPLGIVQANDRGEAQLRVNLADHPEPSPFEGDLSIVKTPSYLYVTASLVTAADPVVHGFAFPKSPQNVAAGLSPEAPCAA